MIGIEIVNNDIIDVEPIESEPVNVGGLNTIIKGDEGVGIQSVELFSTEGLVKTYIITMTDGEHYYFSVNDGRDGSSGADGQDGKSITIKSVTEEADGNLIIFSDDTELKVKNGLPGERGIPGSQGEPGYTPRKGIDYFTPSEIEKIKDEVTPRKGIDYFDGRNGVDGKDGSDAEVTPENIALALGYTPANNSDVETLINGIDAKIAEKIRELIEDGTEEEY